jgi:polyhydroxybutyrate depolymerase
MPRFVIIILACLLLANPLSVRVIHAALNSKTVPTETDLTSLTQPGRHVVTVRIDDRDRKFVFVTPSGIEPGKPLPIVFFFHGAGGSAYQASRTYGWAEKAEKEHFFAVFPEGLPVHPDKESSFVLNPNIWRDERAGLPARDVQDVHFFEVLLGQLQSALPIDSHRIYVTGFSNGAGMTFTLGSHFSNRIAAIAPVSSQSFVQIDALARPLPVYYLTGTADPLIPYKGGSVKLPWGNARTMPPVKDTVYHWTKLDGCPSKPQIVSDSDGVRVLRYGPGRGDSEILFTTIEGNGHHWPDTVEPLSHFISGPSLDPFNATDRIWEFFKAHPLP